MSDVQALSSEADVKTPPLRTFRNTVTLCGALFDGAKVGVFFELCKLFNKKSLQLRYAANFVDDADDGSSEKQKLRKTPYPHGPGADDVR